MSLFPFLAPFLWNVEPSDRSWKPHWLFLHFFKLPPFPSNRPWKRPKLQWPFSRPNELFRNCSRLTTRKNTTSILQKPWTVEVPRQRETRFWTCFLQKPTSGCWGFHISVVGWGCWGCCWGYLSVSSKKLSGRGGTSSASKGASHFKSWSSSSFYWRQWGGFGVYPHGCHRHLYYLLFSCSCLAVFLLFCFFCS